MSITQLSKYSKRHNYSQKQVADVIFYYMAERWSGKDVCAKILGMSKEKIGNPKTAYTKIQGLYKGYGFIKKYPVPAYDNLDYGKLSRYVQEYWDMSLGEEDMLNYFPELKADFQIAKKKLDSQGSGSSRKKRSSSSQSSTRSYNEEYYDEDYDDDYMDDSDYYDDDDYDDVDYNDTITPPTTPTYNYGNQYRNQYRTGAQYRDPSNARNRSRGMNGTRNEYSGYAGRSSRDGYDSGYDDYTPIDGLYGGSGLAGLVIFAIVLFILHKIGIGGIIGSAVKTILWILELVCFYGGIIWFIVSLIRKQARYVASRCFFLVFIGLACGALSSLEILSAIIYFAIGAAGCFFINSKTRY